MVKLWLWVQFDPNSLLTMTVTQRSRYDTLYIHVYSHFDRLDNNNNNNNNNNNILIYKAHYIEMLKALYNWRTKN